MAKARSLKCRECRREHSPTKIAVCPHCFGPLDVVYDYESLNLTKDSFLKRDLTIWRYHELLPIEDASHIVDLGAGFTPLRKSSKLGEKLGLTNLYVKNDAVNPTYSFKDRPTSVAISKALEFGDKGVGCASTGNLAAAVAAHSAKAGLPCYVFMPLATERNKVAQIAIHGAQIVAVRGTYDDANRLAYLASEMYGWNMVNINSRPYYVEGSKTMAFEICEQLGWRTPDQIIIPIASGALLCSIHKGFEELARIGLIPRNHTRINGAQAEGCAPVATAFNKESDLVVPVEAPHTIAKSIAIGDPGDGKYALKIARETKGAIDAASDEEIVDAIKLLAKTEGIFTEPAGSVTIAILKKLIDAGRIDKSEVVVCCVTGNGLKTIEHVGEADPKIIEIEPTVQALQKILS